MLEKNFNFRRESFLFHGDYGYDSQEGNDILSWRPSIEKIRDNLESYRLFQQQTSGGVYLILAKDWSVKKYRLSGTEFRKGIFVFTCGIPTKIRKDMI